MLYQLHRSVFLYEMLRMTHWVRIKNLPFSIEEIKLILNAYLIYQAVKPRFYRSQGGIIKATAHLE